MSSTILYEKEITVNAIDSAYEKGKKEGTIEELEYLKANIRFQGYYNERIEDLIDTQISVLKGEDKSEQADTEFNHEAFYEFLLNVINPNEMEKYRSMFLSSGEIVKGE